MAKKTTIRTLLKNVDDEVLRAIAQAAERALEGYPVESVGELYEQQRGVRLAGGVLHERRLDDASSNEQLCEALGVMNVCHLTLGACGRGGWAKGIDRVRTVIAREIEAKPSKRTR